MAFEVWEQLGRRMPDVMIAPVGDGPTLVALDKGFAELVSCGLADAAAAPGRGAGRSAASRWCGPGSARPPGRRSWIPAATVADGIAVVRPAIGDAVLEAVRRRRGGMVAVSDDALLARWRRWPAGRAWAPSRPGRRRWPGWDAAVERGLVARPETVVLLVTGREVKAGGAPGDLGRVAVVAASTTSTTWSGQWRVT